MWDILLNVRFCSIFACVEFHFFYFENWKHKLIGNPAFSFRSGEIWEALLTWSRETLGVFELFCQWMIVTIAVHDDTWWYSRHVLFNLNKIPILHLLTSLPSHSRPQHYGSKFTHICKEAWVLIVHVYSHVKKGGGLSGILAWFSVIVYE